MVAHDKMRSWADLTVTICGSLGSICRSVITVGLRLGLELRNVVYKLLEKVTKCGAITWLKLTNGDLPRRSTPLHILSCPFKWHTDILGFYSNVTRPEWYQLVRWWHRVWSSLLSTRRLVCSRWYEWCWWRWRLVSNSDSFVLHTIIHQPFSAFSQHYTGDMVSPTQEIQYITSVSPKTRSNMAWNPGFGDWKLSSECFKVIHVKAHHILPLTQDIVQTTNLWQQ